MIDKPYQSPGMAERLARYEENLRLHKQRGEPKADCDTQQSRRQVCLACPHLDAAQALCGVCGCVVLLGGNSKLSMADQACPDQPPRWRRVDYQSFDFPLDVDSV